MTVFANNEVSLDDIEVYGFDYDYTLACYNDALHHLIYKQALDNLILKKRVCDDVGDDVGGLLYLTAKKVFKQPGQGTEGLGKEG